MCAQPVPDLPASEWPMPPVDGYTADDLDRIPGLPPHTELIDGSLVLVSPQKRFHTLALDVLVAGLRRTVPKALRVRREMTVTIGPRQRPEPDVLVVDAAVEADPDWPETSYPPEAVHLVVEVVSTESEERDRKRKPLLYAEAGIAHFWRVEQGEDGPVVYIYEIDPATKAYFPTGIHHAHLTASAPFPVDIDLTEVDRL
ncbi:MULTISPECIES: Uma2 family endonuclease [Nocardiopsis]|uniref:Uma2 family endonuclease n=1 Tax=Nocardiopsis TaxID=2013 RepID=UPI000475E2C7|nr:MULTISPECIES: Uma2 family endonuclease [Nocardiopsis]